MYTVYACSAISLVKPVNPESQIHAQNGIRVKPDPPSEGGGVGTPDNH